MKEIPILFSTPMVQAILEDRKFMTRRVIKPQPLWIGESNIPFKTPDADPKGIIKFPYGQPGDRLWVRETWQLYNVDYKDELGTSMILEDEWEGQMPKTKPWLTQILYKATEIIEGWRAKWRPSIFMPRWASRIDLEVVSVRVERLQDLTEEDAKAEGIEKGNTYYYGDPHPVKGSPKCYNTAKEAFAGLWDSLNAKRGFGWEQNNWLWVVEFKRI